MYRPLAFLFTSFKFSPPDLKILIGVVVFLGSRCCLVCNYQAWREDLLNASVAIAFSSLRKKASAMSEL